MSSTNVFSLKMSFYSTLKFEGNQGRYESIWWCYTQVSFSSRYCFTFSLTEAGAAEIFTRFKWLQPALPTYNLPALPNMPSISLCKSVIRRRYGNLSRFWSNSVCLCPQWFGMSNGELGLQWAAAQGVRSLRGEQEMLSGAELTLASRSPTAEEAFWVWSWMLGGYKWRMKHIIISQEGALSFARVWPLLLSSHLPRTCPSLLVASLLEHTGSKTWSAFYSCKCTKYWSP